MSRTAILLSVMMFLQFFIWGAWLPKIFGYLPGIGFTEFQQALTLAAFNIAAITAMLFSTQFADRNFAAEKFLAFSHLVGGGAMIAMAFTTDFWPFFTLMMVHCLFYVPTISITNSIAFANLKDPQHEFGPVRLWGTIGWIAASWPFIFIMTDWAAVAEAKPQGVVDWLGTVLGSPLTKEAAIAATKYTFLTAGIASLVLAAFSLILPHTPPKPATGESSSLAFVEAARLFKFGFIVVLFIVTFFDSAVHAMYFVYADRYYVSIGIPTNWVMPVMSIGQFAEIGTMALLGLVLKNLGWRTTMMLGILGHALRFGLYAFVPSVGVAIAANVLHGICYAFFFATVYIFVDEFFPKDVRSSAQGLFNFLILGIGPLTTNLASPYITRWFSPLTVLPGSDLSDATSQVVGLVSARHIDYKSLFQLPMWIAIGAALLLTFLFHPPEKRAEVVDEGKPPKEE